MTTIELLCSKKTGYDFEWHGEDPKKIIGHKEIEVEEQKWLNSKVNPDWLTIFRSKIVLVSFDRPTAR